MPASVKEDLEHLRLLVERNPERDADMQFRNGDRRFRAIAGFVIHVPIVETKEQVGLLRRP
ncbi:MAG: hypothetical protein KIT73_07530 [Burkholderiales bacterium]|nr:hypothetical protein [Burkholderiales bacterium]